MEAHGYLLANDIGEKTTAKSHDLLQPMVLQEFFQVKWILQFINHIRWQMTSDCCSTQLLKSNDMLRRSVECGVAIAISENKKEK